MKMLTFVTLCVVLLTTLLSSCASFNKDGPVNIHCPSCNYSIDDRWSGR